MGQSKEDLVQHILRLAEDIYNIMTPGIPPEWLSSDLTVAQLRVMLLLHTDGPSRMSHLASTIGIALSTATGIVDTLVKKEMVLRGTDPHDRRLVICQLSSRGQELTNGLWTMGQSQMKKLLDGLTPGQLREAKEVAEFLLANVSQEDA